MSRPHEITMQTDKRISDFNLRGDKPNRKATQLRHELHPTRIEIMLNTEIVAALPRRTAHALHALLMASRELNMPPTAAEIVIYDEEAQSARHTGAALGHAARLGYCARTRGGYWVASFSAADLRYALEERYLRETEEL